MLIILTFTNKKNDFTHMSNNAETNSHDQEIATLKSTINNNNARKQTTFRWCVE
jgi:hypothetical protein